MLPGKSYAPEEILRVALRRKWWIILPFVLGSIATVVVAKKLPNQYRSETLIMLMPQRVPDSYVKTTDKSRLEERVGSVFQQILTNARLEQVIRDFDLYGPERQVLPPEEVVKRMRENDIRVKIDGNDSFRVSYMGSDPETVRKVTERLASVFIEQDVRARQNMTEDTKDFLDSELADAKRRLDEHGKKVEEFRQRYSRQLDSPANIQFITNAEGQLQILTQASSRDEEQRRTLERQLAEAELPSAQMATANGLAGVVTEPTIDQRLETAEAQLRLLQGRLKPDHPDIRAMERNVQELRAAVEREAHRPGVTGTVERPPSRGDAARQRRIQDLNAQIEEIDRQTRSRQERERHLRDLVAEYQTNLDAVPSRQAELTQLTRDDAGLQNMYSTLLNKRQEWRTTTNLERMSLGDQFSILEPASHSKLPVGPNRLKIYEAGVAASLFAGLFLVAVLEYMDSSFRSESDVEHALKLPALASIPEILCDVDVLAGGQG